MKGSPVSKLPGYLGLKAPEIVHVPYLVGGSTECPN